MAAGYSTREVARLLKMPEHRVRDLVRARIVSGGTAGDAIAASAISPETPCAGEAGPVEMPSKRRELRFDFRDMLVLRLANRLMTSGLPPRRVKRALALLKEQVRGGRPLTGLQVFAEGDRLLASDGRVIWEPESGQQQLPFDRRTDDDEVEQGEPTPQDAVAATPHGPGVSSMPTSRPPPAPLDAALAADSPMTAERWFDLAMDLEETEPHRSYQAYLHTLEQNPEHVEAHINIGRLCSAAGELERAAAYFRQAIRLSPHHPVAHFNLAVTLHDLADLAGARDAYRLALQYDADFADAHYNLAALLEQMGDVEGARKHMELYEGIGRNQG